MILTLLFIALLGASYTNIPSVGNPTPNTFNETIKPKKIAYNVDSVIDETITPTNQYISNIEGTIVRPSPMQGPITYYTRERNNITKYEVRKNENYYTLVDTTYVISKTTWIFTDPTRETLDTPNGASYTYRFVNIKKITPFSTNGTFTCNGEMNITSTLYDANNNPLGYEQTSDAIELGYDYYIQPYYLFGEGENGSTLPTLERANTYNEIESILANLQDDGTGTQLEKQKLRFNLQTWAVDIDLPSSVYENSYYVVIDSGAKVEQYSGTNQEYTSYNTYIEYLNPYVLINNEKLYFQNMTNENYWNSLERTEGGQVTTNYDLLTQGNTTQYQDWHIIVDTHGETGTEVVDIPGMMWQILIMPFSFISQAFNVTIFEGTPYQLNFANLFKGLIAIMTLLFVIRIFTGGINMLGEYSTQVEGASAKREQRKRDRKLYKDSKNGVVEKDVE